MMILALNEATAARRRLPVYLVDATDGVTPETGVTFSAGEIKVSANGAAQANHVGTVTEVGLGLYYYECDATEVATEGFLSIIVTKTGVRTFHAMAQVRTAAALTTALAPAALGCVTTPFCPEEEEA